MVGLIAASLAYGRVEMIMKNVGRVLGTLGSRPRSWVETISKKDLNLVFKGFVYRFATQAHLICLIQGIQSVLRDFGSIEACLTAGMSDRDETVLPGLTFLYRHLDPEGRCGHLLADPAKNSACKRSHLFLRWMVRDDAVDPGGWTGVRPDQLMIPLDRHMYTAGTMLGFTRRKSADRKTCLEITSGFKQICPEDPVKYDFSLTRFGIRRNMGMDGLKQIIAA